MDAPKLFLGLGLLCVVAWWAFAPTSSDDDAAQAASKNPADPDGASDRPLIAAPPTAAAYGVARSSFLPEDWNGQPPEKKEPDISWREGKLVEKFQEEEFRGIGNSSVLLSPDMKPGQQKGPAPKKPETGR